MGNGLTRDFIRRHLQEDDIVALVAQEMDRGLEYEGVDTTLVEAMRRLPRGQRTLCGVLCLIADVSNYGFAGYFTYIEEEGFYQEARDGLVELGAMRHGPFSRKRFH